MKVYKNISELVGKTPLLELQNLKKEYKFEANIIAKLEYFNPAGSSKDRVALNMIEEAEKKGLIDKETVIIEPTSGNTGIGLSAICASKGYKVIFTMPETMSVERRKLLSAYGAEIVLTDGALGMLGSIEKAKELSDKIENSFIPSQFDNMDNPNAHKKTTGPEIWEDLDGDVDIFVAPIGTGGTLSGVGEYLKQQNPKIRVIGVEPYDSPLLTKGYSAPHKIQGIGANFVPKTLNTEIYDEIVTVKTEEAYEFSRFVAKNEGILVGISSGASLFGAYVLAKRIENKDKNIVALLPDTGERYLSSELFTQ